MPLEPFRSWLLAKVEREEWQTLAERWGVSDRSLRRVALTNTHGVALDLVDKCLLEEHEDINLMYPYEGDDD